VSIDHTLVNHGTLLDSFEPPVNPPAEIDDPNDKMPAGMSHCVSNHPAC
jgi:calnexin